MSIKIESEWNCPQCIQPLCPEECESAREMLKRGHSQIDFTCDHCGEQITADTSDCDTPAGSVELNEQWVYD